MRQAIPLIVILTTVTYTVADTATQAPRTTSTPAVRSNMVVTTGWLAAHISGDVSILHIGADRKTYDAGHIPGARFVALSELVRTRDGTPNELPPLAALCALFERLGIGDTGRVVLYGDESGLLAARAFFTLDYLGHGDRAALLDGGLEQWRAEGRTVSTAEPPAGARPFTPRLNPEVLAVLPVVRDVSWLVSHQRASGWALVDARPEAQFSGAEAGADVARPGHIPGAASLFWRRAIVSTEHPVLRPIADLRRMYEEAGAAPRDTVVTYCRTGVQASHAYFVARYLGYQVRMYDGSFIEWSKAAEMEVAASSKVP